MYNILEHKQEIAKNIQKAFGNTSEEIEKAKWQIGEIRVDSRGIAHECYEYTAEGKPRLRRVKKNKGASNTSTDDNKLKKKVDTQITDDKEVASFMDKIKTFNNKYNDPSKVSVSKTPKGNWNVRYDGHRLGIIDAGALSEETANKQGWNEGSGEKFKQRWKNEHKNLSDETIQSYADNSRDVKYKQDVVDAAKELLEERKKEKQEEKKKKEDKEDKKVTIKSVSEEFESFVDSKKLNRFNSNKGNKDKEAINAMYDISNAVDCIVNIKDGYKGYSFDEAIKYLKNGVKVFQDKKLEFTSDEDKKKVQDIIKKLETLKNGGTK